MEVLVVIALLGLVVAVVTTDFGALLDNARAPSAYETLRTAVDSARRDTLNAGGVTRLVFDREVSVLRVLVPGAPASEYPLAAGVTVAFSFPSEETGVEALPLDALLFHPSGCSTPARVELTVAGKTSRFRLEPFSGELAAEDLQ